MSATHRTRRGLAGVAVGLGIAVAAVTVATPGAEPTAHAEDSDLGSGGEFHPLTPARVLDTRHASLDVAPLGPKPTRPTGSSFTVKLLGEGGIPDKASDVLAVVANVTVANPTAAGYLRIRPDGATATDSSLVNFGASRDVPNMVVVGLGAQGGVTIDLVSPSRNGTANVLIDVYGWIAKSSYADSADAGARLIPTSPTRILDTRSAPVPAGWQSGLALQAKWQLELPIRGNSRLSGAFNGDDNRVTGVLVNITAVNTAGGYTYVSAVPERIPDGQEPPTSVTNLVGGQIKANTAIVPVGADGKIRLFNSGSATHLIVDVLGYLRTGDSANTTTGRVVPLEAPFRAFDTRQAAFGKTPLGYASQEDWSFDAFAASVKKKVSINGVEEYVWIGKQSGLIGNLTATGLTRLYPSVPVDTFLTVFPGGATLPNSSILNLREHEDVPNTALIKYGTSNGSDNVVKMYNDNGSVHYILDVFAVVLA